MKRRPVAQRIVIRGLELYCRIGVPADERAKPQRLLADITVEMDGAFAQMEDDVAHTLDYNRFVHDVIALAEERPRKLIETLATEINALALDHPRAARATTRVRKFILGETEFVAVESSEEKARG